jgi:hypothetical protein
MFPLSLRYSRLCQVGSFIAVARDCWEHSDVLRVVIRVKTNAVLNKPTSESGVGADCALTYVRPIRTLTKPR